MIEEMATIRAVVARAINEELTKTRIRDKKRKARLPKDLINLGAYKKNVILPVAPRKNKKLTAFGSKKSLKKEE